jgi:hypothetical protein
VPPSRFLGLRIPQSTAAASCTDHGNASPPHPSSSSWCRRPARALHRHSPPPPWFRWARVQRKRERGKLTNCRRQRLFLFQAFSSSFVHGENSEKCGVVSVKNPIRARLLTPMWQRHVSAAELVCMKLHLSNKVVYGGITISKLLYETAH